MSVRKTMVDSILIICMIDNDRSILFNVSIKLPRI